MRFVVPTGIGNVSLEVRMYADSTRIPVGLSARSPIPDNASLDDFGHPKSTEPVLRFVEQVMTPMKAASTG